MGSPKVSNAKPQIAMDNKPIKTPILSTIKNFFKDKKKEKAKCEKEIERPKPKAVPKNENANPKGEPANGLTKNEATVANILDTFKRLDLKERETKTERKDESKCSDTEDESTHFTFKVIEDDRKRHSSEDSGYSEAKDECQETKDDEVAEAFEKLNLEEQKDDKKEDKKVKEKKLQDVAIKRGPTTTSVCLPRRAKPYSTHGDSDKQVNHQINKHILSGGHVIVNSTPTANNYTEVDIALKKVEQLSQNSISDSLSSYWQDVLDVIHEDCQKTEDYEPQKTEDLLKDFKDLVAKEQAFEIDIVPSSIPIPNAVEVFTASQTIPNYEESIDLNDPLLSFENVPDYAKIDYIFPTPPRSENVPSPISESQASFYLPNWDNSLSPERSSPIYNTDLEKYQDISQFEELSPISDDKEGKKRDRTSSISAMTMKNFKDMQKEISNEFSKKDCCQINRKSCKDIFDGHMSKLKSMERKNLCFKVSKMDLKTAYGVLHHIILSLATGSDQEDLQYALFVLICQRILAQTPTLFFEDFGLSLLKSAVMRCPHRPILTRFIVHYVYEALKGVSIASAQECVFDEVDAQGDTLVIACARAGDSHALVLAEITRADIRGSAPPLFRVHHANSDGYTALHVACSHHSAASPRLHTQHVLLEHAQADLWKGDIKGGDTALHLAVNSVNCDLRVIMMLFKQIDRKMWKKLAHWHNMSSVTPLEYARSATKSTTRQNYPHEVLDFLKKCR